jgi:predicted naringenin-chalcone synthase
MMRVALLGIGTATPEHTLCQSEASELAIRFNQNQISERAIRALYRRSGVKTRSSVLANEHGQLPCYDPSSNVPTTADRMCLFKEHAVPLACEAAKKAIADAEITQTQITHLITVSCTGFLAPGIDSELIKHFGLSPDVSRTNVGFMGCHAAINAITIARSFAAQDPHAMVLVCCVELCTLHFDDQPDANGHVANALFGDGAAALVIAQSTQRPIEIKGTASRIIPDTADLMSWTICDHGFRMHLSPTVPAVLSEVVPEWLDGWLGRFDRTPKEILTWAIHPGGPRILGTLQSALDLANDQTQVSRDILEKQGNMSSTTLLFILEKLIKLDAPLPLVALAFGPGLAAEGLLLVE